MIQAERSAGRSAEQKGEVILGRLLSAGRDPARGMRPRERRCGFALIDLCLASVLVAAVVLPLLVELTRHRLRQFSQARRVSLERVLSDWVSGVSLSLSETGERALLRLGEPEVIIAETESGVWRTVSWDGGYEWQVEFVPGADITRIVVRFRCRDGTATRVLALPR